MQRRVKYPLTPETKAIAEELVNAWNTGKLEQILDVAVSNHSVLVGGGVNFQFPLSALKELEEYRLIRVERTWVTLLQELRDAVANDFEVSDFFLTTSAVGTIIYGNLTLDKGALFQSAAAGIGDVNVTAQHLPDELVRLLGEDARRPEIAAAITELKTADESTRLGKMGKVIEELGRGLSHMKNAAGAIEAIILIARILGGGGL